MPLNEADTRARLLDPQLEAAGWSASQIGRELEMGQAPGVVRRFGATERLQQSLREPGAADLHVAQLLRSCATQHVAL